MSHWTLTTVCLFLAIANGLVNCAPSAPKIIEYYEGKGVTQARPVRRTPLRIVASEPEAVQSKGSITYYTNEIDQQQPTTPYPAPQRLSPVAGPISRQYAKQRVTRIHQVPAQYNVVEHVDPIQQSLAASPLRLIPLLPVVAPPSQIYQVPVQQKYFGASNYVDDYVEPIKIKVETSEPTTVQVTPAADAAEATPAVHYNYETSFGDVNDWAIKPKVPITKKAAIITKSTLKLNGIEDGKLRIDKLAKLDKYRLKSVEEDSSSSSSSSEESKGDGGSSSSSSSEEDDGGSSSSEEDSSEEKGAGKENSDEEEEEEKKENNQQQYPVNYYSQVRQQALVKHQPAPQNDLRVREKISTKKTGIVYSEQGYNDKSYDHGRFAKLYEVHQRYRRDAAAAEEHKQAAAYLDNIEILPIPLALEKVKNATKLNGDELIKYIQDLINNSTKFLPAEGLNKDEEEDNDYNSITSLLLNSTEIKKLFLVPPEPQPEATETKSSTEKYPFLNIPATALRYAENHKNFPKPGESDYALKRGGGERPCGEIEPPTLQQITDFTDTESSKKRLRRRGKKRLTGLGRKIDCLKKRHFGSDPLDNPLFKERSVDDDASFKGDRGKIIPKLVRSLDHSANPSVNVYDDVISNIRSAIVAEHAHVKDRNQMEILKLKAKANDSEASESQSHVNQTVADANPAIIRPDQAAKDGIFDISKFLPRTYYDNNSGVMFAVQYKKRKSGKKGGVKTKNHSSRHKDYTVFPSLVAPHEPDSSSAETSYGTRHRKRPQRPYKAHYNPVPSPPKTLSKPSASQTSLSSGYYPYPVLAARKKRFHYELLRNTHGI